MLMGRRRDTGPSSEMLIGMGFSTQFTTSPISCIPSRSHHPKCNWGGVILYLSCSLYNIFWCRFPVQFYVCINDTKFYKVLNEQEKNLWRQGFAIHSRWLHQVCRKMFSPTILLALDGTGVELCSWDSCSSWWFLTLSSGVVNRTLSHIRGGLYIPVFLFRVRLLTVTRIDSLMVLAKLLKSSIGYSTPIEHFNTRQGVASILPWIRTLVHITSFIPYRSHHPKFWWEDGYHTHWKTGKACIPSLDHKTLASIMLGPGVKIDVSHGHFISRQ